MSKLRLNMMMSLDGFVAGPGQSAENPFGIGRMQLNEWSLPLNEPPASARSRRVRQRVKSRR